MFGTCTGSHFGHANAKIMTVLRSLDYFAHFNKFIVVKLVGPSEFSGGATSWAGQATA